MKFLKIIFILFFVLFIFNPNIVLPKLSFNYKKKVNDTKIIIEIETSGAKIGIYGPAKFTQGLNEILPYNTSYCSFIASKSIFPINSRNKTNYFYLPFPHLTESIYNEWVNISKVGNLLLGPIFFPHKWFNFPNKNLWNERMFRKILEDIKTLIVHSNRVRDYLANKTNTTNMIKKYNIVRPCTNLMPKYIKSFENRTIDIIFFEKYADLNRRKLAIQLMNHFLNSSKKIERIIYGGYTKNRILKVANNSKFIIYFSFYDTGAIGLKEIQNFGVFVFSHQKDLIIDNNTGFYIPELGDEFQIPLAYFKIIKIIEKITNINPNTQLIAQINQNINKCQNALDDLCKSII